MGSVDNTSGAKVISFGCDNPSKGLPVSHADGFINDKDTGERKMTLECITASDLRTGWFALVWFNLVYPEQKGIEVFIMGAGPIATACILMLSWGAADRIKRIKVLSLSGTSAIALVKRLKDRVAVPMEATSDRGDIRLARFLVTATNAGEPVAEECEIGEGAAVLSQGIDDLPKVYIRPRLMKNGWPVGDDLYAMQERNVDPLALAYSREGEKLTVEGKRDGAINIGDILSDPATMQRLQESDSDKAFFPVGLIMYDLAINIAVMEALIEAIRTAAA